ncbi:MAG: tRNA dimethylallyltransferase [Comamonadaceae bacterium BICA1-1]|nr:MAG: tRNA dimethylallyltransferase [Comamonadaceae bacterium BICA1-1]
MTLAAPAWIALAGPTASGKSALALELARRWPVEIISVDSALVYRGLDIGSAKPSPAERAAVPHHLIDILEPQQSYSAAAFVADAQRLLPQIMARGRLPLLVGGTLLYFKALFEGLDDMPAAHPALRVAIEAEAAQQGWPALHAQLAAVDAPTAARLSPNDAQRIGRALEVWRASGRPLSSFHTRTQPKPALPATQSAALPAPPPLQINGQSGVLLALEPLDRAWLHHRIAQRFATMLEQGFIDEVRALRKRPELHPGLPALRSVGYRQVWEALDALAASGRSDFSATELAALIERGTSATRQLAKRQLTWLRSLPQRQVLACETPDLLRAACALLERAGLQRCA